MWRYMLFALAVTISIVVMRSGIGAQQQAAGAGDSGYIAKVMTAAPPSVVRGATIVQMQSGGTMRTVQAGTNQFTCMVLPGGEGTPMCADKNAAAWLRAVMTHSAPPNADGFMYMLAGDTGTSNTDPYATAPTATNHWVKTGPHVMIFGPNVKAMGYPATADADTTKPYVMWPDTPYAHLMLPVAAQP